MSIKNKIKIRNDASKSVFKDKTISDDYKSGGAYKAMLSLFADHVSDEEYAEHCRKFFKGDNEKEFAQHRAESGKTSTPVLSATQKRREK